MKPDTIRTAGRFARCLRKFVAGVLGAATLTGSAAHAQTDRILDTPTGWTWRYGASASTISADIAAGFRPFSIQRVGFNQYNVVTVANSGAYAAPGFSSAHTYYGLSPAALASSIAGERIIDLECTDPGIVGGAPLLTAVTIPNSGAQGAAWYWNYDMPSSAAVANWLGTLPAPVRVIDLERYTVAGVERWAAVAVANTGAQSQSWWWYFDQTEAQVSALLLVNGARLIDVEVTSPPTFFTPARYAVVMVGQNTGKQWWDGEMTEAELQAQVARTGARITCLERYSDEVGQTRYAVAMVDNANAQTRRVRDAMDAVLSDGEFGFELRQVGGPELAGVNQGFECEPASMLKILHGSYAIRQCALGQDSLTNHVWVGDPCNNDSCPDPSVTCGGGLSELLQSAIKEMLFQSDNPRTMAIEMRYGRDTLNAYALSRGLTHTQINHRLGCLAQSGGPFNKFAPVDVTSLYEQIADGSLFDASWRETLFACMTGLGTQGWTSYATLDALIAQEASATNLTGPEIDDFRAAIRLYHKVGGYQVGAGPGAVFYRTEGGWASLPFMANQGGVWQRADRQYTFCVFVHGSTDGAGSTIPYTMKEEMLREQVREALASWDAACTPPAITDQPDAATRLVGQSVTFSVSVSGTIGHRYWLKSPDGVSDWSYVAGNGLVFQTPTTASVQFVNLTEADAGYYRALITSPCGDVYSHTARLIVNTCAADFNHSGGVSVQDIFDFMSAYFAGLPGADINGSGAISVQDVFDFLARYFAGC